MRRAFAFRRPPKMTPGSDRRGAAVGAGVEVEATMQGLGRLTQINTRSLQSAMVAASDWATAKSLREEGSRDCPLKVRLELGLARSGLTSFGMTAARGAARSLEIAAFSTRIGGGRRRGHHDGGAPASGTWGQPRFRPPEGRSATRRSGNGLLARAFDCRNATPCFRHFGGQLDRGVFREIGIPFTAPEGRGTPVWWTPLDTRSLDLITRARFRRWTNASVTTRPAASTSVVCAGLRDSPAPIAERRGSHG